MNPGDVRLFEEGNRRALVVAVGVWAQERGDWIDIHMTGPNNSHTTVTNRPDSERYHQTLFRVMRAALVRNERWLFGNRGAETTERRSQT